MQNPAWKEHLTPDAIRSSGFEPFEQENTDPEYQIVATEKPSEADEAKTKLWQTDLTKVHIWHDDKNPDQLYLSLGAEEPEWLQMPIAATTEALSAAYHAYVDTKERLADSPVSEAKSYIEVNAMLQAATGRISLLGDYKTMVWSIGGGDHREVMSMIESDFTLNTWLAMHPWRSASASGDKWSQWCSEYSRSLITVKREQITENESVFVLEIQYYPVSFHTDFTKECTQKYLGDISDVLADDLPLDVLGFFAQANFSTLDNTARAMKRVEGGERDYLLTVAVLTSDEDFEAVFTQFAQSEHPGDREFTAQEAFYRKNQKVLDLAIAAGISTALQDRISAVQTSQND